MNKTPHHSEKKLIASRQKFNKLIVSIVAALAVVVGIYVVAFSHAATNQMYLSPASGTIINGNNVTVAVRVDSGATPINAVQANLKFNPAQLQFVSLNFTGSAFPGDPSSLAPGFNVGDNSAGTVQITRFSTAGTAGTTGDQLVGSVTFKAVAGSGSASVTFASGTAAVPTANSSQNVVSSTGPAAFTLAAPAVSTPTPTPVKTATPTPVKTATPIPTKTPVGATATPTPTKTPVAAATPTPTKTPIVKVGGSTTTGLPTVSITGAGTQKVAGSVALSVPSADPGSSVDFSVDGSAVTGSDLDTTDLSNGDHTVTAAVQDSSGDSSTVKQKINVANPQTLQQQLVAAANKAALPAGIIFILLLAVGGTLLVRRSRVSHADIALNAAADPTYNTATPPVAPVAPAAPVDPMAPTTYQPDPAPTQETTAPVDDTTPPQV